MPDSNGYAVNLGQRNDPVYICRKESTALRLAARNVPEGTILPVTIIERAGVEYSPVYIWPPSLDDLAYEQEDDLIDQARTLLLSNGYTQAEIDKILRKKPMP